MSENPRRFPKGLIVALVLAVIFGCIYGAFRMYRAELEQRAIQAQREYEQEFREREAKQDALSLQKAAESRAGALRPASPQPTPGNNQSRSRVKSISDIAFSPDGKFVSAMVAYDTNFQLMIWPVTGGSTLYRHESHYYQPKTWVWLGKNQLLSDGDIWQFHKNAGFWQLEEKRHYPLMLQANRNGAKVRDFPNFDLRLRQTKTRTAEGNPFALVGTLEAYALSSGTRLPLPESLRIGGNLDNVEPLARWGKAPLRLALWLENTKPVPRGQRDKSWLEVWDARAKKRLWQKSLPGSPGRLQIAGQGRWVVAVGVDTPNPSRPNSQVRDEIAVFDAISGAERASAKSPKLISHAPVVSPDGKLLAIYSDLRDAKTRRTQHYVTIYGLPELRPLKKILLANEKQYRTLAFSPDNRWLAVEDKGQLILLDWRESTSSTKPQRTLWL